MREKCIEEVRKVLKTKLDKSVQVYIRDVSKNNGIVLCGVSLKVPFKTVVPTIYIDDLLSDMEKGIITAEEVADYVIETDRMNIEPPVDVEAVTNRDFILENVQYQLINTEKNSAILQYIPHKAFLDLTLIYRVHIKDYASLKVSNDLLKVVGIELDELDAAAMKNTKKAEFEIVSIGEKLGIPEELYHEPKMYIMSNPSGVNGAVAMTSTKCLKDFSEKIQNDFYILPSSVHEVLCVPVLENVSADALRTMVKEVNESEVAEEEILGYSVYKYRRETGKVEVA